MIVKFWSLYKELKLSLYRGLKPEQLFKINKKVMNLTKEELNYDKGDYKYFMEKEIDEQPLTINDCINEYVDKFNNQINIFNFPWKISSLKSIVLIGCGTAYHSCLLAKYWFEELTSLDVNVDIASEFRYRKNKFNKKNLYIFVSQSGETADTFAALDLCRKNKAKTRSSVKINKKIEFYKGKIENNKKTCLK